MSDIIKYEFVKILDELEVASLEFDALQAETAKLKELYKQDPNNQELLAYIKQHEEKYRVCYERFVELNRRSKELKEQSDAESEE